MKIINKELYSEQRPWGSFLQFTKNESTTVKIIFVKAGEQLSLQYHNHRSEFWYVLSGLGGATIGSDEVELITGNYFLVPEKANHQIRATTNLQILEISYGDFDENDIVRLNDIYGRAPESGKSQAV